MIADLQRQLSEIYQVGHGHDVRDYLITDPLLAKALGGDAIMTNTAETLLVSEDDEGMALSLFLEPEMLERLKTADPLNQLRPEQLDDLWKVLEGISHFTCMVWKASQERAVSLLELELQGEIDKFVSTIQMALSQGDSDLLNRVHGWLFDAVSFSDELDAEQLDRYRAANDYASRYCLRLHKRIIADDQRALRELRGFYRMQLRDKISHIHTRTWN